MPNISRRCFLAAAAGAVAAPSISSPAVEVPVVLDHILLGCSDLDHGIDLVEKDLGVRAAFGGVHPGRGTRNALLSLGEKHYLEIIAPDPRQPEASDFRNLRKLAAPRLVGWAARPGDLDQFSSRLRDAGIVFEGPQPGSRQRPDGGILHWKTLTLKDDRDGLLPFFIEWGSGSLHPSADAPAGSKLLSFELAAPDVPDLRKACELLELDVPLERGYKPQLRARFAGPKGQVLDLTS